MALISPSLRPLTENEPTGFRLSSFVKPEAEQKAEPNKDLLKLPRSVRPSVRPPPSTESTPPRRQIRPQATFWLPLYRVSP